MNISVIIAHPNPKSFNHAIARTVCKTLDRLGHEVWYHDLYQENFPAVLTGPELVTDTPDDALTKRHQREITEADGIVIVHPNWWGQPPALLKGWVDRVLRENVAYAFGSDDSGGGVPKGLLKAKAAVVFNTSNTPMDREQTVFGNPLETLWRNCVFHFCGVDNFSRRMFCVVADSTEDERKAWLKQAEELAAEVFG